MMLLSFGLFAQNPPPPNNGNGSPGSGSSGNPYQAATLNNLYWLTQNSADWGKHYIQTANIDATATSGWDGGNGFTPIGTG